MAAKAMFSTLFPLLPLSMGISTLTSCGAEDSISRRFLCRFTFHTQNHPGNTLEIALNGFGTYTFVSASYKTTSGISTLPPTMAGTRQKTSASPQLPNCNMPRFTI